MITSQRSRDEFNSISAESFARYLITEIESKIYTGSTRLDIFVNQYNKEFKTHEFMNPIFCDVYQPNILRLMTGPLTLYALKMNGQVLIELAAILERYAIMYMTELFSPFPERQDMVRELVERQFLEKLAIQLIRLGLWDKDDLRDVRELKRKRDRLAHKNVEKFDNGKTISILEIDLLMSRRDVLPYIMVTIRLLLKLMDRFFSKTDRGIIAQQIMEGKIKDKSEFLRS